MDNRYRYTLETGSKKHICPRCRKKTFVRFIDTETGDYLPPQYGRCDREANCSYHLDPRRDGFSDVWNEERTKHDWTPPKPIDKPVVYYPDEVFHATLKGYDKNVFVTNLLRDEFDTQDVEKAVSMYGLGTVTKGNRTGAVTFPFIDEKKKVRTIQVKQFDEHNHTTATDFIHSIIERNTTTPPDWIKAYNENDKKVSCLFGAHLLHTFPSNPIALVEAPKTAIYGTLYFGFPETSSNYLWLAVYNLSSLTLDKCKVLTGRNVTLFPDLSKTGKAYATWKEKAVRIEKVLPGAKFTVSDLLEKSATEEERNKGFDLADYLIRYNWKAFRTKPKEKPKTPPKNETPHPLPIETTPKPPYQQTGTFTLDEVKELERYFEMHTIPDTPIQLNSFSTIIDPRRFVQGHLSALKSSPNNPTFTPYMNRLKDFKNYLIQNN